MPEPGLRNASQNVHIVSIVSEASIDAKLSMFHPIFHHKEEHIKK